ncbi:DExH-box ATP-dependent RNA helicase DExH17 isoform X2 [Corylus avellana]|uniref:DExH-box ATP-dependent RNA helicase DExH17 isoform X2 n=1 Tax=Corylus avellana TaxID=13451 RepID=UPI00286C0678|nr:DExH-box ATP-dependent RNA helicase DExH17 isoform X2 [Corylus avellana]
MCGVMSYLCFEFLCEPSLASQSVPPLALSVYQEASGTMDSYTLKSVLDLPAHFRSAFNFRYFNSLQSECFPVCFHSDANMVISAPTGSGKTVLFELCILRLLSKFISEEGRFIHLKGTLKAIYIAPSKALVQEKLRDWNEKFGSWGINCLELTSDNEFYNMRNIQDADIIVTTPEKFDAVTRYRIKDGGLSFFGDIALLLIDEVHLLNDPRGATLEAIVSRIKMLARYPEMRSSALGHVRFIAVSATIPNIEDLAEWLLVPVQGIKRFGEEMRPVKLTTKVFDVLMQYSRGKSALVFCSTRKGAQEAAQCLSQTAMTFGHSNSFVKSREQQERLREASLSCSDKQMQSYIIYGVGYHNGGVCLKDRNLIESLFLKGDIQIICTTNTLAHGINLPAHTVVIKSTQHFNKEKGLYMEYDRSTILQMSGRAGRPPFDDTGMVIIMTRRETVHLYENLLNGCEMVESQLLSCVTEHLTAEIVQLTVSDITRAIEWMKCSYLYVRMKKNPENYLVRKGTLSDHKERDMQEICVEKVNELSRHQMIWTDEDGFLLKPLEPGKLMTKYYLKFDTMKHIMQTPVNCSLEDALHIICRAEEIAWIQLRRNEKKLLNDINTDKDSRLRFHILGDKGKRKKRIQTREEKIFVLANDCLTGDPSVHDLSLTQDMNSICTNGCRIAKCMKEYFIYMKNYRGALNSTLLAKSLHQKLWDDSPYLLKQLPGIGMVTAKALHSMGINSFETLAEADPRRMEIVTGRKYPFGNHIKDSLLSLPPKVDVKMEEIECQRQGKSKLVVTLTRLSQSVQSTKRHYADMIVGSEEDNLVLFHEKIRVEEFSSPYSATILLSNPQQGKLTIKADLIFEEYIGIDLRQKLLLMKESKSSMKYKQRNKQPSSFPPPEEIHIIDDNEATSRALAKELHNSANSEKENDFLPSFKLIDEEMEEAEPDLEVEEDECKIITAQTVFDHIREKAKNFPVLASPSIACFPSSEASTLTRRRTREKRLELHSDVEFLEERDRNKITPPSVVNPSSEPGEAERNGHGTTKCTIPPETTSKTSTEESIFDDIRKKSRNFPVINKLKTIDSEALLWTKEHSSESRTESGTATSEILNEMHSDKVLTDTITEESTKVRHNLFSESSSGAYGLLNLSPRVSSPIGDLSSIEMLSSDISTLKNNGQSADHVSSMKSSRKQQCRSKEIKKQHCSPSVSRRQFCSSETASETREADSFLGFQSVFSFL